LTSQPTLPLQSHQGGGGLRLLELLLQHGRVCLLSFHQLSKLSSLCLLRLQALRQGGGTGLRLLQLGSQLPGSFRLALSCLQLGRQLSRPPRQLLLLLLGRGAQRRQLQAGTWAGGKGRAG